MKHIKAIICDWDDTKVASLQSCLNLYKSFSTAYKLDNPSLKTVASQWGKPLKTFLPGLWPGIPEEKLTKSFLQHAQEIDFCLQPFPFTKITISSLKKAGYKLGVISSGPRKGMENTIRRYLHLPDDTYTFFFSGEDFPFHKPDPRVFDAGLELLLQLGISSQEVIYVGDNVVDYQAAAAKGISFIAVTTGFTTKEQFINLGLNAKNILHNFGELPAYLQK